MKNLFNGNNTCTYKKCPKSVRNLYTYLKKKTNNINASIKKINTKDKFDKLYDKYDNLLNNIKKRKTYKKYVDCTCNLCKSNVLNKSNDIDDRFQVLDLLSSLDEKINVKKYINKSLKLSKKFKNKINKICE